MFFFSSCFSCVPPVFLPNPYCILSQCQTRHETKSILDCGMTSIYCDLLFVKRAVNSGGIMLQHPVLWPFVSAPFPTKAVVKSHRMISWPMKQSICFFVFSSWANRSCWHFNHESQSPGRLVSLSGGGSGRGLPTVGFR